MDETETSRVTLYDIVKERVSNSGKAFRNDRMIYVAKFIDKLNAQELAQVKDLYGGLIRQNQKTTTAFSGILAVYPTCILHIIEGQGCDIISLLNDINKYADQAKIEDAKVMSSSEDIPWKAYKDWYCAIIEVANAASHADSAEGNQCVKMASDINLNMVKLGRALAESSPMELSNALGALASFYEDLPTPEQILSLVASKDLPNIEEFLEIFNRPINLDLDSEQVWPMPQPFSLEA